MSKTLGKKIYVMHIDVKYDNTSYIYAFKSLDGLMKQFREWMIGQNCKSVTSDYSGEIFTTFGSELFADIDEMIKSGGADDGMLYDWHDGTILVDYVHIGK